MPGGGGGPRPYMPGGGGGGMPPGPPMPGGGGGPRAHGGGAPCCCSPPGGGGGMPMPGAAHGGGAMAAGGGAIMPGGGGRGGRGRGAESMSCLCAGPPPHPTPPTHTHIQPQFCNPAHPQNHRRTVPSSPTHLAPPSSEAPWAAAAWPCPRQSRWRPCPRRAARPCPSPGPPSGRAPWQRGCEGGWSCAPWPCAGRGQAGGQREVPTGQAGCSGRTQRSRGRLDACHAPARTPPARRRPHLRGEQALGGRAVPLVLRVLLEGIGDGEGAVHQILPVHRLQRRVCGQARMRGRVGGWEGGRVGGRAVRWESGPGAARGAPPQPPPRGGARTRGLERVEGQEAKAFAEACVGVAHDLCVDHHAKRGKGVVQQLGAVGWGGGARGGMRRGKVSGETAGCRSSGRRHGQRRARRVLQPHPHPAPPCHQPNTTSPCPPSRPLPGQGRPQTGWRLPPAAGRHTGRQAGR